MHKKNNIGIINAGVTSFSPSLMKLQYEILEKDFNIRPNIVVAYIDQTDIGDDFCRYRPVVERDKNNTLKRVHVNRFITYNNYDFSNGQFLLYF